MGKNNGIFKKTVIAATAGLLLAAHGAAFAADGIAKRADIKPEYKWNLEAIYADKGLWEKDFKAIEKDMISQMEKYKGKLTSIKRVAECFALRDKLMRTVEKVCVYAALKSDENSADNAASEMRSRAESLAARAGEAVAFIEPELLGKSDKVFNTYLKSSALKDYRHYFDSLKRQKKHTLSKEEEELLAKVGDMAGSPNDIFTKAKSADMKFPTIKDEKGNDIQLSNAKYGPLLENQSRDVRKAAFEGIYGSYDNIKNTLASTLNAEVKKNIFFARARKYKSALEAAVESDNIPVSVYANLVKAVNDNVGSLHKYVALRKKVLGLDKVHLYDMYAPLLSDYEMNNNYEDAKKMVLDGLKPMGEDYIKNLSNGFASNWVDVYETENKYDGAYNWGTYDTHPYILMNYNDTLDSMLTLAHESGHAMHAFYTNKTQKYINSNPPIFTAEVASTTNELIMIQYLIKKAKNNTEKLYLINNLVENIRSTVYTQVMYAEFEKLIHERVENGDALSADSLRAIWKDLMVKYYGQEFAVDDLATLWWSRIPHFYMNFYVYKYATGISAAYPLSQAIVKGEKGAAERYLGFLKAGDSDYPIEVLKKAGVDMSSTKPVDALLAYFDKLVDEMEVLLKAEGKIK